MNSTIRRVDAQEVAQGRRWERANLGVDGPCPECGQADHGQTGEYPCSVCGLPWLHDEPRDSNGAPI